MVVWTTSSNPTEGRFSTYKLGAHPWAFYTWMIPATLVAILWMRRPVGVIAGAVVYVVALLPVLGLSGFGFQLYSSVADRYAYLPMFGFALALAWLLARPWCQEVHRVRAIVVVAVIVTAALSARTIRQIRTWHDTDSMRRNQDALHPMQWPFREWPGQLDWLQRGKGWPVYVPISQRTTAQPTTAPAH